MVALFLTLDYWGSYSNPAYEANTLKYIRDHASIAQTVGKPLYLGEYGMDQKQEHGPTIPKVQKLVEELGYCGSNSWILMSAAFGGSCTTGGHNYCAQDSNIKTLMIDHAERMNRKLI